MLSQDVQAYLAVRRAMGFGMKWSGNLLRGFAAFSDAAGQHHVCSEAAIKWAGSTPSVRTRARRLGLVIRLARYLRAEDQRHEVPPPVFGSEERPRRTPYIYSREDVQRLVQAASGVGRYLIRSIAVSPTPHFSGY
jgi:integrase/recombinase XerD